MIYHRKSFITDSKRSKKVTKHSTIKEESSFRKFNPDSKLTQKEFVTKSIEKMKNQDESSFFPIQFHQEPNKNPHKKNAIDFLAALISETIPMKNNQRELDFKVKQVPKENKNLLHMKGEISETMNRMRTLAQEMKLFLK